MAWSRLSLNAFPGSSFAAEMQRGAQNLPFVSPKLEAEYVRNDLTHSRKLIRMVCTLSALLTLGRALEVLVGGAGTRVQLIDLALVNVSSLVLVAIAWSADFERLFLRWASVFLPVRNSIVAVHIAHAAARGQTDMLMILPLLMAGPFFLLRLNFRTALWSGVVAVLCFIGAALYFAMPLPIALRSCALLLVAVSVCAIAARHLEKCSRSAFLERHVIAELAQRDALTGTNNRRVFDDYLGRLWTQAVKDDRSMAILLIDVDHFKGYNDRYGHQAGDQALRQVAQTLQTFVRRPLDVLARYGGEEFAVILYDVEAHQAEVIAQRIHRAVGELVIEPETHRTATQVTISVGVALVKPTHRRNVQGALQLADQALYEAKAQGRNRVEFMDDVEYTMLVTGVFSKDSLLRR